MNLVGDYVGKWDIVTLSREKFNFEYKFYESSGICYEFLLYLSKCLSGLH